MLYRLMSMQKQYATPCPAQAQYTSRALQWGRYVLWGVGSIRPQVFNRSEMSWPASVQLLSHAIRRLLACHLRFFRIPSI